VSLVVVKAGLLTTVQDAGREGLRHLGVGLAGAVDAFSARVANLIVGNGDDAALLEITMAGPTLRLERGVRIAICGASIDARIGTQALPGWRRVAIPAGSELRLGGCRDGARAYLAFEGGLQVPPVLGSRATDVRAGLGMRALAAGDRIGFDGGPIDCIEIASWWLDPDPDLDLSHPAAVHVIAGRDALQRPSALHETEWRVAPASDRQGLRLQGPPLALADARERVSAPVAPGTVQLPPDGQPIVLLAEAQTVGGYPVIGHVARADLPRLAQCRPGDSVHFRPIEREAALARWQAQNVRIERMQIAVAARR